MNLNNRRLKEIQREKTFFKELLNNTSNETDKTTYQGKIDILENEEKQILKKQGVQI